MSAKNFSYREMTSRNIGFISEADQEALRQSKVFVIGTGGMGGACLQALVRAGVGSFEIADTDTFETSNLNRQVFATTLDVGQDKAETTRRKILEINPEAAVTVHGPDWLSKIDEILGRVRIVVNGMDDIRAGILLYRKAREHGATVVDAYTSSLPSVITVKPHDPRPEERLGFPTVRVAWDKITDEQIAESKLQEIRYVMTHSSSASAIDLSLVGEMVSGKRPRMSYAPMVITTGTLMSYEILSLLLDKKSGACSRGYFFNPLSGKTEHAKNALIAWFRGKMVDHYLSKLLRSANGAQR